MADVVVFHLVGAADLGIDRSAEPGPALDALAENPDLILRGASRHPGERPAPLPSTIDQLNTLGHRVAAVVLFVTQQSPSHPSDTSGWLEPLRKAIPQLAVFNNDEEITVDAELVTEMSISAFANAAVSASRRYHCQVVVPIAGGAKAGFLGLLIGATAHGLDPMVLPVNRDGEGASTSPVVDVDVMRWLVRRRMWSAVAALDSADVETRELARDLDGFERENLRRGRAGLPADHVAPVLSRMISDWATEEPTWVTHISRMVDELTHRSVEQLPRRDREVVRAQAATWVRQHPDVAGRSDSDICVKVAARRPWFWEAWTGGPEHLRSWLENYASVEEARRARHGKYPRHPFSRVGTTGAHKFIADVALGRAPRINPPLRDPLFRHELRDHLPAVPDTPAPGARLAVRITGQRELNAPQIARAADRHHRSACAGDETILPVLAMASTETASGDDLIIDPHNPERARRDALIALRRWCDDRENQGMVRIRRIALYLNQGTQVMSYAVLTAVISVAAELGAELELLDLRVTPTGDSAVTALPTPDVNGVVRHALRTNTVRSLLRSCIETLHLGQALKLVALLDDPSLTQRVQSLGAMVLRPLDNVPRADLGQRLGKIAPGLALVLHLRPVLGDRDVVGRVAIMLSAAVASETEDRWDQLERLEPLRKARNAVFHRRGDFVFPATIDTSALISLAKHFGVKLDTVDMNAAIALRESLLVDLARSGDAD